MRLITGKSRRQIFMSGCGDSVSALPRRQFWQIPCAEIADSLILPGSDALAAQSTLGLWLGMFAYMLQIYLDFSAYSDMAIGMEGWSVSVIWRISIIRTSRNP